MRPHMIILAGGLGTRLHSVTEDKIPKCMVNIYGKPFLARLLDYYTEQGFSSFTILTNHLEDVIKKYPFNQKDIIFRKDVYVDINRNIADAMPQGSWVVNGDTWISTLLPPRDLSGKTVVLVHNNKDAGAQLIDSYGLIKVVECGKFYDIGTPEGLDTFRGYWQASYGGGAW